MSKAPLTSTTTTTLKWNTILLEAESIALSVLLYFLLLAKVQLLLKAILCAILLIPFNFHSPGQQKFSSHILFLGFTKIPFGLLVGISTSMFLTLVFNGSLVNSVISVVFLTGMVGTILLRVLRKDIARYNEIDLNEDVQEDSGWKLVHGDVFRAPKNRMLLSVFLGSGAQLFFMTGGTMFFALLGFLSPSNRGSLTTVMIIFYTFWIYWRLRLY